MFIYREPINYMPHKRSASPLFQLLFLAMTVTAGQPYAGAAGTDFLTHSERAWLDANPEIRVAPDPDFPPIEYIDRRGRYQGIAADYLALLEKKLAMRFTIVQLSSWDQALKQARSRKVDMFAAATSTSQRREYMNFTAPHLELPGVILVRKQVGQKLSLKDLHGLNVAVVSGYVWQELISRDHPEINLKPVTDLLSGLKKVSFGSADAMVANLATATYYIEQAGITNLRVAGETGYYGRYALAVRKDWPVLNRILEKGLARITAAERAAILKKWIGLQRDNLVNSRVFCISLLSCVAALVAVMIIVWIWLLKKRVAAQTADLRSELQQRQRAEHAHQQSERRYRTLFETASDAIFMMSKEQIVTCNDAATRMFGCSREQFLHRAPYSFSPQHQADGSESIVLAHDLLEKTLNGQPQRFEWRHLRFDGTPFDAEVSLNSYHQDDRPYILAIVRDISERKRIDRLKDEFVSTVSHEIRTPLTSIRGSLELILGGVAGELPEEVSELLEIADSNSKRLLSLVNELLDIQKLESGQMRMHVSPVNVAGFLQEAINANQPYCDRYQIRTYLLPVEKSWRIQADKARLMQVMSNLLSNAAKFSPAQSGVEIEARLNEDRVRISVTDQGKGIAPSFQPYIFDRFTQADSSDKRRAGGTGLGLNISRAIIELHGGEIKFNSRVGRGTEFYFELPLLTGSSSHPEKTPAQPDNGPEL